MKTITAILILLTISASAATFERCHTSTVVSNLTTVVFSRAGIRPLAPYDSNEVLRARDIQRPTEITGSYVDEITAEHAIAVERALDLVTLYSALQEAYGDPSGLINGTVTIDLSRPE